MLGFFVFLQIDSLSLDQTIDLALARSPIYYESKISLDKSRILFYQTLTNLLPTVTTTATYTKSEWQGISTDAYSASITLNQSVFDIDVLSAIFVSEGQLRGTKIRHQTDISSLILRLKTAYYNLINARELLESSEVTIKRAEENLELISTKYELGAASRLEMLQSEVFHLKALEDRARARTTQTTAQEELRSFLGTDSEIYPTDTLPAPDSAQFPSLDSLASILEQVNYNIQLARELRNVAKLDLVASYLSFLPKVSFFYGYTYSADSFIFDFQEYKDNATKNYGVSFSFPIFEIKSLIFNHLNAKKELQQQEYSKQRIILETEKSLRTTYYALVEAYDRLRFAGKSRDAATEAVVIAREQYALGAISFLDFLTAEKDLYDARVSFTSALSDFYIQRAQLSYLLGELSLGKRKDIGP